MEMVLGVIADRDMFGLRMDYVVIFWNTKNFTIRRNNMSDIDIARKGLEVAIHLHVEACNRKAVREFAERLKSDAESGTGDIEKLLDDCVSLSNSNATFLYLNYIDKVLAEYEKEKTHEQNK